MELRIEEGKNMWKWLLKAFFSTIARKKNKSENMSKSIKPEVFDEEFVKNLPELTAFQNSLVTILCRDKMRSNMRKREFIENCFLQLDGKNKKAMLSRIRSLNDDEHLAAFFELALHNYFKDLEIEVIKDPEIADGKTPDFKLQVDRKEVFVEARTIMMERAALKAENSKIKALDQINKIKTRYSLVVYFEADPNEQTKPTELRRKVEDWLREIVIDEGKTAKSKFDAGGYSIELLAQNWKGYSEDFGKVVRYSGPVKWLGASLGLIHRGIEKKRKKYKEILPKSTPYVIAICSTDGNFVLENLWMTVAAFGSLNGESNDNGVFDWDQEAKKHPELSGLLHCQLLQDRENFSLQTNYFPNPAASFPVPSEFKFS